jgi:hypothetical protein
MTSLTAANDLAIRRALEAAGVEFIAENGGGSGTPKVCSLEIISLDCTPVKGRATANSPTDSAGESEVKLPRAES